MFLYFMGAGEEKIVCTSLFLILWEERQGMSFRPLNGNYPLRIGPTGGMGTMKAGVRIKARKGLGLG